MSAKVSSGSALSYCLPLGGVHVHDLLQTGVYEPEERAEPLGLEGGQMRAVAVPSVDPGVQRVAPPADHRDGVAVRVLEGRGDRHAERLEPLGGAVLAGDGLAVAVEMVLEEVRATGGGEPVAAVEEALGDGLAGEWFARVLVAAQQCGRWEGQLQMSAALARC